MVASARTALGRNVLQLLFNTIDKLEDREVYWACDIDIPVEVAVEMIIPDERDRAVLHRAWELTDYYLVPKSNGIDLSGLGVGIGASLYVEEVEILWPWRGRADPDFTSAHRHPAWGRVEAALQEAAGIKRRWNDIKDAASYLNERCSTSAQMRFHMAALPALLCADEATKGVGQRLTEFKVPQTVPRIPDRIRTICRDCTEWVASALLYPEIPKERRRVRLMLK